MRSFFVAALLALAVGSSVVANADHEECKADVEKFCAGVEQGQGRILKCLHKHKKELSAACIEKMTAAKQEIKDAFKACHGDREKFCGDVKHGRGKGHHALVKCFQEHEAELSAECKTELAELKALRAKH